MKRSLLILVLSFVLSLLASNAVAQEQAGTGPGGTNKSMGRAIKRSKARAARKELKEKRKLEKANKKAIKAHHKRIQTKGVQKRMKKSKKRANKANRGQHL
ncbi:MAG: hypothetical protein K0S33_2535 [Bacteroidetes bacterium]|jgi:hypothetical protein|nr:hypothetical protein [Bacteroidota bacterium]